MSLWILAGSSLMLPLAARAQLTVTTTATGHYETNSNVYDEQSGFRPQGESSYARSDSLYAYGGALDVLYGWSAQEFFARVSSNVYTYDRFTQLDHTDYKFDGGWRWNVAQVLQGSLDVLHSRSMVPFVDIAQSAFSLETEQRETAKVEFPFANDYRLDGTGILRTVDEPIPAAPELRLRETSGIAALRYLGRPGLSAGFEAGYLKGDFTGAEDTDNPSYRQQSVSATASYKVTGLSTFLGVLGYTRRTSSTGTNNISGGTGELDYKSQLTGKTSIDIQLNRNINSYISSSGSEIDTSAAVALNWQTTYKLGVQLGYTYTYRNLPGQGNAPLGSDRIDHQQLASLRLDYQLFRWLTIRPYASVQTRSSDYISGNFNATVYGIDVIGTYDVIGTSKKKTN